MLFTMHSFMIECSFNAPILNALIFMFLGVHFDKVCGLLIYFSI
jgi:hypothetical protein